jgi:murein DD-endopeptidase MepM/ murein hydrolase activator NlpD
MVWPIDVTPVLPDLGVRRDFGSARNWSYHSGIDLYCPSNTPVRAMEDGEVVAVEHFTKPDAQSPGYNNTWAVLIYGISGTLVYGEIWPQVEQYSKIKSGQIIGHTLPIFKRSKLAMLHFERYDCLVHQTGLWRLQEEPPSGLVNPRPLLERAMQLNSIR